MLRVIADGKAFSQDACKEMLEIMLDQQYRSGIRQVFRRPRELHTKRAISPPCITTPESFFWKTASRTCW